MRVHTNITLCQRSIRGHGRNTRALNLDMIPIKFGVKGGLSLGELPTKCMRVERNDLIVVVVEAKVTTLEPVTQGNMLYILE